MPLSGLASIIFLSSNTFTHKHKICWLTVKILSLFVQCLSPLDHRVIVCFVHTCPVLPEKAMAPHFSTLAWKTPWTEEPGGLQSMGSWRVGHDWATSLWLFTFMHWRRTWQPTPVFLAWRIPGTEEPGMRPSMGSRRVGHDWSDLAAAAQCFVYWHYSQYLVFLKLVYFCLFLYTFNPFLFMVILICLNLILTFCVLYVLVFSFFFYFCLNGSSFIPLCSLQKLES